MFQCGPRNTTSREGRVGSAAGRLAPSRDDGQRSRRATSVYHELRYTASQISQWICDTTMLVQLNCRLLEDLIEKHGGVKAFLDRWHSRSPSADEHLSRATVYRWIGGESGPKNVRLFLRLAGLLDVDPFALLDVPDGDALAAADEVLRFVQNSSTRAPWLQFVHSFFRRQISWPPEDLAAVHFGRPWLVREFTHDPATRANYYATVLLRPALRATDRPQVIHF